LVRDDVSGDTGFGLRHSDLHAWKYCPALVFSGAADLSRRLPPHVGACEDCHQQQTEKGNAEAFHASSSRKWEKLSHLVNLCLLRSCRHSTPKLPTFCGVE